jgi:serine protease Do
MAMKIRFVSWPRAAAGLVTTLALATLAPTLPGGAAVAQGARDRGYLGVLLQDLSGDLRDSYDFRGNGVLITDVTDGSPADRAGLREGDIVTRFRGRRVDSSSGLTEQVRSARSGERVSLTVWRDGRERTMTATLGSLGDRRDDEQSPGWIDRDEDTPDTPEPPDAPEAPMTPKAPRVYHFDGDDMHDMMRGYEGLLGRPRLGVEIQDLDRDLGEYFDRNDGKGVLVLHVVDGSAAKSAGMRAGDIIVELGGRSVDDADDLRKQLRDRDAGPVSVIVVRRGGRQTLNVRLPERRDGPMAFGPGNKGDFRYFNRSMPAPRSGMGMDSEHQRQLRKQMDELRKQMNELRKEMRRGDRNDNDNNNDNNDDEDED